ncbi:MAG: VWA domain-containing protein [Planctomyces sp.]
MTIEFAQPSLLLLAIPAGILLWLLYRRSLSDFPVRQRQLSMITRSVIMLLLLCSAAGMTLLLSSTEPWIVFVTDVSRSIGTEGHTAAQEFLRTAELARGRRSAAWISFASTISAPALTPPAAPGSTAPADTQTNQSPPETNIERALDAAVATVPPGFVPRVVLLTDGHQTTGDALAAATRNTAEIWTVPLPAPSAPEVQVSSLKAPHEVREGEPFLIEAEISANHPDEGTVELFRGEFRVAARQTTLQPGNNVIRFEQSVERDRVAEFRVRISGLRQDTLLDNNSDLALVSTSGKPRVLLVESEPDQIQELAFALEEQGIPVDVRPIEGLPESLEALQNFELLVLSNVPATKISRQQMTVIQTWVRDFGGGFLMLGGDQSFGLGGYYQTPIDELLPVRSDFEKEQEKPSLGMVLVIDRSGSMEGEKLEMARAAASAAVDLLGPRDQIAVIAFDDQTWVISELQPAASRSRIADQISRIQPGGGTNMFPAMESAFETLNSASLRLKHVIMLTDGISNSGNFEGLARQMSAARMTVSVVALGPDDATDLRLLKSIATLGRGRFYHAEDAAQVPRIFAKETLTASKAAINEEPFLPQIIRATRTLADIDLESAPLLLGSVVTRPKAAAEVILATEKGDPLLAWWRYGLGMTGAFTSDAKNRWAAEWISWPGFGKFWTQTMRQLMRPGGSQNLNLTVQQQGQQAVVTVNALLPDGTFLNTADVSINVINPALQQTTVPLPQTAPGQYAATIPLGQNGIWNLEATLKHSELPALRTSRSIYEGRSDEFRLRPTNQSFLQQLAAVSGGVWNPAPAEVFQEASRSTRRSVPLRTWLLSAAAFLLVLDVALRRLEFRSSMTTRSSQSSQSAGISTP